MALIMTFKGSPLEETGRIQANDTTEDGEQFIGIKLHNAEHVDTALAIYVLNRNEAQELVVMLTELLNKGGKYVH